MKNLKIIVTVLMGLFLLMAVNGICGDNSLIVRENGYVGIGTNNPIDSLTIKKGTDINTVIGSLLGSVASIYSVNDANNIYKPLRLEAKDVIINSWSYGNVGIGTSNPIDSLTIKKGTDVNTVIGSLGSVASIYSVNDANNIYKPLRLEAKDIIINFWSSGNVGIGTTNPSYKLDVNGTIRGHNVSPSDIRWKTNISTLEKSLEKISQLRGVSYEWIDPSKGVGDQIGIIAQEVEDVFPEVVSTDSKGFKSVAYAKLVGPLIEAVKKLKTENEILKKDNEDFRNQLSELKEMIKSLQ